MTQHSAGVVIVEARGEVDTSTCALLINDLGAAVDGAPRRLVAYLAAIDFFSSAGIPVLLDLQQRCQAAAI